VLINKMDRENANFERSLTSLKDAFKSQFIPLMLPIGSVDDYKGVVNILERKAYMGSKGDSAPIPSDLEDQVEDLYNQIVEAAVESDEELMEKYFDDVELTPEEIAGGLQQTIIDGSYIPVLVGAGGSEFIGLKALLDLITLITPSPDQKSFSAETVQGEEEFPISDASPLALLVFKTLADPYVGKQTFFKVYGGVVNSGDTIFNKRANAQERLGQLYAMRGKEQIQLDTAHAGDIVAVAKMAEALTNDTLCDKGMPLTLRGVTLPESLYSVAVFPLTKQDTAKMGSTLTRICEEDPTLRWRQDATTNETILSGMGDAHVDTAIRRMKGRFNVGVDSRTPKVPYLETITKVASSQYRHKKQSGGAGQFAEVHMRVEPVSRNDGFDYVWEVFGGRISSSFRPSIEKGIKQVLNQGVLAGFPIVDVRAAVTDGKEHPVDSKDIAFQIAGREGFKQAFLDAKPVLLEPIYLFTITVPDEYAGAVMSDLNTRRGRVQGMEQQNSKAVVIAEAPLAEMLTYATNLRAITQGRGIFSMEFVRYDIVPSHMLASIVAAAKAESD
jgi:elongation factor G